MNWLVENKDLLQTLAAVFNGLGSLGLLAATIFYVLYTRTLAKHAETQANHAREQATQATIAAKAQREDMQLRSAAQYFLPGDSPEQQAVRRRVWQAAGPDQIAAEDASQVASYWHFWGMMVRRGLLPDWVFEGSSGLRVKQYFDKLQPFINNTRESNLYYAEHFEWLARRAPHEQDGATDQTEQNR